MTEIEILILLILLLGVKGLVESLFYLAEQPCERRSTTNHKKNSRRFHTFYMETHPNAFLQEGMQSTNNLKRYSTHNSTWQRQQELWQRADEKHPSQYLQIRSKSGPVSAGGTSTTMLSPSSHAASCREPTP